MSIRYLSEPNGAFSDLYIRVREKENRILTDEQVAALPNVNKNHEHHAEWQLRKLSADRFVKYLEKKDCALKILDVGCGNGWFSHLMSTVSNTEVTGLDVNVPELEQASNIFKRPNLSFVYADLYENTALQNERFNVVVFNSCFQYFEDAQAILRMAKKMLSDSGEIHIIDTPFYKQEQIESARKRTRTYYENLGFPKWPRIISIINGPI